MTLSSPQTPLQIPLKTDPLRRYAAIALMLLALLAIVVSGVLWWQKLILGMLVVVSALWQIRRWQSADQWLSLRYRPAGQWSLLDEQNNEVGFDLQPQQFISPGLIIVHGKPASADRGRVLHLWVWKHQHDHEAYRHLAINITYHHTLASDV